jgi:hypothetical protein
MTPKARSNVSAIRPTARPGGAIGASLFGSKLKMPMLNTSIAGAMAGKKYRP